MEQSSTIKVANTTLKQPNIIKLADKELIEYTDDDIDDTTKTLANALKSLSYTPTHNDKIKPGVWAVSEEKNVMSKSGLGCSLLLAYSYHRTLVLKPDDIWLHLTQQVSKHILKNPGAYKHNFVNHSKQKLISVEIDDVVAQYGLYNHETWEKGVARITDKMTELVNNDTVSAFVHEFSTTQETSLTANKIVLMDAMKHYFTYRMTTRCGIPKVEMQGTENDWIQLIEKAKSLHTLVNIEGPVGTVISNWFTQLYPVLENLLATYDYNTTKSSKVDVVKWWSHIADEKTTYGSGGTTMYYGWITKLYLYNSEGKIFKYGYGEIDDFVNGVSICPFEFQHGLITYKLNLVAGHAGSEFRESDGAVVPVTGWAVVDRVTVP